jgi:putative hydrolase of HD superfamily
LRNVERYCPETKNPRGIHYMDERFRKQIEFIIEIDKIKSIFRKTKLFDNSRYENDSEHSWHLALMAIILSEYANTPIDLVKVIKMVVIHDIVEIDTGDKIVYAKDFTKTDKEEYLAAERIFGLLPEDQKNELKNIWLEFEEKKTAESKFAFAIDRLEPIMQNYYNDGATWRDNDVKTEKIVDVNKRINDGSSKLWEYAKSIIEECVDKGFIN